jgi:hypothetical protein
MTVFGSSYVAHDHLAITRNTPSGPARRIVSSGGRESAVLSLAPARVIGAFPPAMVRRTTSNLCEACCLARQPGPYTKQAESVREVAAVCITGILTDP